MANKTHLTTVPGQRAYRDICCLRIPKEDIIELIHAAVEQLYLTGGPDIRKRVEVLISSASEGDRGQNGQG